MINQLLSVNILQPGLQNEVGPIQSIVGYNMGGNTHVAARFSNYLYRLVALTLVAVPIMWVLGLEQLVWFPVTALFMARFLFWKSKQGGSLAGTQIMALGNPYLSTKQVAPINFNVPQVLLPFGIFLISYGISGFAIQENMRYISFLRDLSIYLSYGLLFLMVYHSIHRFQDIQRLLSTVAMFGLFINLMAITYFLFGDWEIHTFMGKLLPSSISATTTGQNIAIKSVGRELYFFGFETRIHSLFSSAIHYAVFLLTLIPITVYLILREKGIGRYIALLNLALSLVCMFFTQSRSSFIILFLLPVCFAVFIWPIQAKGTQIFLRLSILFLLTFCLLLIVLLTYTSLTQEILEVTERFFVETRKNSYESRSLIYTITFSEFLEKPFIGHGTQRDVHFLLYPLGSHNWYLSLLYKHGIIGAIPMYIFLGIITIAAYRNVFVFTTHRDKQHLANIMFIVLVGYLLVSFTLEPIVDAIQFHIFAIMCAINLRIRDC